MYQVEIRVRGEGRPEWRDVVTGPSPSPWTTDHIEAAIQCDVKVIALAAGAGDAPPGVLIFNDGVAPRSFNEENGEVKGLDWSLRTMSDIECFPATAKAFTVRTPHHGHFLFVFSV
jgi:hypothetical protein